MYVMPSVKPSVPFINKWMPRMVAWSSNDYEMYNVLSIEKNIHKHINQNG